MEIKGIQKARAPKVVEEISHYASP